MTPKPPTPPTPKATDEPYFIIAPPSGMTVDHQHKAVLWLPNGKVLVRRAGFLGGA